MLPTVHTQPETEVAQTEMDTDVLRKKVIDQCNTIVKHKFVIHEIMGNLF